MYLQCTHVDVHAYSNLYEFFITNILIFLWETQMVKQVYSTVAWMENNDKGDHYNLPV